MKTRSRSLFLLAMLVMITFLLTACGGPEATYKQAQALLAQSKYTEAAEKFGSLGSYEDAVTLNIYCKACALCEEGHFETGIAALEKLGDYKDCAMRITYYTARSWDDSSVGTTEFEQMQRAKSIYSQNPLYLDGTERIAALDKRIETAKSSLYNTAVEVANNGNYKAAQTTFNRLGSYKDSSKRHTYYGIRIDENAALTAVDQDAMLSVAARYTDMGDFLDSSHRAITMTSKADAIVSDKYAKVAALVNEGKYVDAEAALASFGIYGNEQVTANYYIIGEKYLAQSQWDAASAAFDKAGQYADAVTRINEPYYKQGESLLAMKDEAGAIAAFKKAGTYSDAADRWAAIYYAQAERLMTEEKWAEASAAFFAAGLYRDAVDRIGEPYYRQGESLLAAEDEVGAIAAFKKAGTYSDAADRWRAFYYEKAERLMAEEKWAEASTAFSTAVGYRDALSRAYTIQYQHLFDSRITTSSDITIGLAADGTPLESAWYALGYKNPDEWNQLIAVAADGGTALGLKSDGTVVIADTHSKKPDDVSYWKDIIAIDAGTSGHVVGLKIDGTVVATGNNSRKQCAVWDWKNIIDIAAGYGFTAGLKVDGTVVIAGDDSLLDDAYDWTGIISIKADTSSLVGLKSDGTVVSTSFYHRAAGSWKDIKAIAVGEKHLVGLMEDGTVVGTGYSNYYGKCDVTDWKNIVAIAAGDNYTIGLVTDGTVVTVVHDNQYCDRLDLSAWNLF